MRFKATHRLFFCIEKEQGLEYGDLCACSSLNGYAIHIAYHYYYTTLAGGRKVAEFAKSGSNATWAIPTLWSVNRWNYNGLSVLDDNA